MVVRYVQWVWLSKRYSDYRLKRSVLHVDRSCVCICASHVLLAWSAACLVVFDRFVNLQTLQGEGILQTDTWSYHFSSSLPFSSPHPPVASLCPSTVTPLASDAAFHCNDIPTIAKERERERAVTLSPQVSRMTKQQLRQRNRKR